MSQTTANIYGESFADSGHWLETMFITLAAYIITPVSYSTQSPFLRFVFPVDDYDHCLGFTRIYCSNMQ